MFPVAYEVNMGFADKIIAEAKRMCAIDTGQLRASIMIYDDNASRGTVRIAANTGYAVYVEWGTSRMVARPFMRPAVEKYTKQIAEHYVKGIARLIK